MNFFAPSPAFASLSFGEQLTLWALRMRRAANDSGEVGVAKGDVILARAFALVGAHGAERHISEFLALVEVTAERGLALQAPAVPHIADDELRLLGYIGACQAGREKDLANGLGRWLPPTGVRLAASQLAVYAAALSAQGLVLRSGHALAGGVERSAPASPARRPTFH